ncbi:hypothetical protein [Actinotalea sp. C106]|uniref:hypothetical protein n=1 Tax=Actinotalea sp. C106 TaxID=2908644 RepID=UPI002028C5CB|nr:hypothetical protein [Actinotalea sp. C106]
MASTQQSRVLQRFQVPQRVRELRRSQVLQRSWWSAWWRGRTRSQARVVLGALALVALTAGVGAAGLISREPDGALRAGIGEPHPGSTEVGPVSLVLPEALGPWAHVPDDRMDALRSTGAGQGMALDGAWGRVAPGGLLLTVLSVEAGSHRGVDGLAGPYEAGTVEVAWRGSASHRTGSRAADGVREIALAVEHPDGYLLLLSVSGPQGAFMSGELQEALSTVRVAP